MKLSILIPTMSTRASLLSRLLFTIEEQLTNEVEVLIHEGDDIGMGDKLNRMFKEAKGDFVVCVDDDDYLASDYIDKVCSVINDDIDYVSYKVLSLLDGKYRMSVPSTITGSADWDYYPQGIGPKWPIRSKFARKFKFPNEYKGDKIWSAQVHRSGLRAEAVIDKHLYIYDHWGKHSLGTEPGSKAEQRDVGTYPYNRENFRWLN